MPKSTTSYWNTLGSENHSRWKPVTGVEGIAEEVTLSVDEATGEYTRLTRFLPGADTARFGGKRHEYPEEVFVLTGRLYDAAFGVWLEPGCRAQQAARRTPRTLSHRCRLRRARSLVPESCGTSGLGL